MENTNNTNAVTSKSGKKSMVILVVIIIILAIIAMVIIKNKKINREVEAPSQINSGLENTMNEDTTAQINENINKIDTSDTSTNDLKAVDEELKKL